MILNGTLKSETPVGPNNLANATTVWGVHEKHIRPLTHKIPVKIFQNTRISVLFYSNVSYWERPLGSYTFHDQSRKNTSNKHFCMHKKNTKVLQFSGKICSVVRNWDNTIGLPRVSVSRPSKCSNLKIINRFCFTGGTWKMVHLAENVGKAPPGLCSVTHTYEFGCSHFLNFCGSQIKQPKHQGHLFFKTNIAMHPLIGRPTFFGQ